MEHSHLPHPPILDYHRPRDDREYDRLSTIIFQIVAFSASLIFAAGAAFQWFFANRPMDRAYLPAITVSLAGSATMLSLGIFVKQKRKPTPPPNP